MQSPARRSREPPAVGRPVVPTVFGKEPFGETSKGFLLGLSVLGKGTAYLGIHSSIIKVGKDTAFDFNLVDACKLTLRAVDETGKGIPGVSFMMQSETYEYGGVVVGDNLGVTRGGSWMSQPSLTRSAVRQPSTEKWKESDPQSPPSAWYITDAPFVGFRVVRPMRTPTLDERKSQLLDAVVPVDAVERGRTD
jgi:hypothetical protein